MAGYNNISALSFMTDLVSSTQHCLDTIRLKNDEYENYFSNYLTRHHFCINSSNVNVRMKTGFEMRVNNVTSEILVSINTTIVWTLLSKGKKCKYAIHVTISQ